MMWFRLIILVAELSSVANGASLADEFPTPEATFWKMLGTVEPVFYRGLSASSACLQGAVDELYCASHMLYSHWNSMPALFNCSPNVTCIRLSMELYRGETKLDAMPVEKLPLVLVSTFAMMLLLQISCWSIIYSGGYLLMLLFYTVFGFVFELSIATCVVVCRGYNYFIA